MKPHIHTPAFPIDSHFLHPIQWLKQCYSGAESRRQQFSMPYSVNLPILPSNLHAKWDELSKKNEKGHMNNNIFHYEDNNGLFFTALLEVNRWQGVFSFSPQSGKEQQSTLTPVEFWGMALREHSNLDTPVPNVEKAQGAVFWQNGTLNIYPANSGQTFERFLREKLLS